MIFVGVGENDSVKSLPGLRNIRDIRNDQVDSQEIRSGEHQAAVDGDGRFAVFDHHHVEPKFTQPA